MNEHNSDKPKGEIDTMTAVKRDMERLLKSYGFSRKRAREYVASKYGRKKRG